MQNIMTNKELLIYAATHLKPLLPELVFLGGSTTTLFITDPGAPAIRPTKDVDVIVEVSQYHGYAQIEERLRELGFHQPVDETEVICRWHHGDLLLDVMPTDEKILGFGNLWYPSAIKNSRKYILADGIEINVVTPPYFIGTKIEAFEGRGKGDLYASSDFEDIIAVIDGREELIEELGAADAELKSYIARKLASYSQAAHFREVLQGLIPDPKTMPSRLAVLEERIHRISNLANTYKSK